MPQIRDPKTGRFLPDPAKADELAAVKRVSAAFQEAYERQTATIIQMQVEQLEYFLRTSSDIQKAERTALTFATISLIQLIVLALMAIARYAP